MTTVVSDQAYVPVLPYHGTLWPRAIIQYAPRYMRRVYGTTKVEIVGADKLRASIAAGHGILLTPNHCREEDPFVLSMLARKVRHPFFVVASTICLGETSCKRSCCGGPVRFRSTAKAWTSRRCRRRSRSSRRPNALW